MRKFTKRERLIFVICLITLTAYIGYDFIFHPIREKQLKIADEIKMSLKELQRNIALIKKGESYAIDLVKMQSQHKQTMSDDKTMSAILAEIEDVANQTNMSIARMKPQKVKETEVFKNFSISLAINGSLVEVLQFLHALQSSDHLFDVNEIRVDKISPRHSNVRCQLIISKGFISS